MKWNGEINWAAVLIVQNEMEAWVGMEATGMELPETHISNRDWWLDVEGKEMEGQRNGWMNERIEGWEPDQEILLFFLFDRNGNFWMKTVFRCGSVTFELMTQLVGWHRQDWRSGGDLAWILSPLKSGIGWSQEVVVYTVDLNLGFLWQHLALVGTR